MRITVVMPDQTIDATWLCEQLEVLQAIRENVPEGGHWHTPINIYEDRGEGYGAPDAFLLATDEAYSDDGFKVLARVIFHTDGSAYIDPFQNECEDDGYCYSASGGTQNENNHQKKWTKGTWADGILALAKSLTSRLKVTSAKKGQKINDALKHLVETIGDTKVDVPQLETET